MPVHFKFSFFIQMVNGSMNYMNSKDKLQITKKSMQNLSRSICDFIGYWQFRRFHGALQYELIKVESVLEVDRNEKGSPWMAHIKLHVTLSGANQEENALRILEKTTQS